MENIGEYEWDVELAQEGCKPYSIPAREFLAACSEGLPSCQDAREAGEFWRRLSDVADVQPEQRAASFLDRCVLVVAASIPWRLVSGNVEENLFR